MHPALASEKDAMTKIDIALAIRLIDRRMDISPPCWFCWLTV
jgi:hypothetical protein